MITLDNICVGCGRPFKVEVLEPPETRYVSCPHCRTPHRIDFKQKQILHVDSLPQNLTRKG
jgi:DNA-directed RNA polymerase subunit RPC12/RpoP